MQIVIVNGLGINLFRIHKRLYEWMNVCMDEKMVEQCKSYSNV
jgi:hypothetical protein